MNSASILYHKYHNDPFIRGKSFTLKKKLKILSKSLKIQYKDILLKQIQQFQENNPKKFWQLVEKLNIHKQNDNITDSADPVEWFNHFSNLLSECNTSDDKFDNSFKAKVI